MLAFSAVGVPTAAALSAEPALALSHASHQSPNVPCSDCSPDEHAALCEVQACTSMMCNLHRGAVSSVSFLPLNLSHEQFSMLGAVAVSAFYCPDLPPPR
ncbi:hypothetical protein ACLPHM_05255 [Paenalcaligenes sp. Me131]|uniref:hypothetical protein n=1 Tax=Paenalcaligenes sp. Me131 TaxID=3392636 RepID=UPI003D2A6D8C